MRKLQDSSYLDRQIQANQNMKLSEKKQQKLKRHRKNHSLKMPLLQVYNYFASKQAESKFYRRQTNASVDSRPFDAQGAMRTVGSLGEIVDA